MRDQLRFLAELQQLDSRLRALEMQKEALPEQLRSHQQACDKLREELTVVQTELEEAEQQRRELERDIDVDNDRLIKAQNRLHEVKTNKEYTAALGDIETVKRRISALEDRVLELMEGAEQHQKACQRCAQQFQEAAGVLAEQELKVREAQDTLSGQIAVHSGEREVLATRLQPEPYAVYRKASEYNSDRVAAVGLILTHETCGGCYLRVRPQLVSDARKHETIVTCPHCKRILLWPAES